MGGLVFGGGDVAELAVEAALVEPVDVFGDRNLDVPGSRPRARAISRTPLLVTLRIAISSRSSNVRYRPEGSANEIGGMLPA